MPRYIDIEPFEAETGLTVCHVQTTTHTSDGITVKATRTRDIPTVDPESLRPHGRWERNEYGTTKCSGCKKLTGTGIEFNYCPNCGAKMIKGEDDG